VKVASIEKMKSLGYAPKVSLREGVHRVVEWQLKEVGSGIKYDHLSPTR
jgi:nucleoside-diphosphate-sugar epimerase